MTLPDNVIVFAGRKALKPDNRPITELDDDELMLLARGGKKEAFDTLVRRHQAVALLVAAKFLGQVHLAKDAAQNAFIEILGYLDNYQPRGKFRSFMFKVLLNQCRMAARSAKYERKLQVKLATSPQKPSDLPEELVIARERRREVERALYKLSMKFRAVLVLRFAGGLQYAEIAEVMELPIGTVKSRIFSGLEKLRNILEGN